jgi:preprotein translocase SecF subunit
MKYLASFIPIETHFKIMRHSRAFAIVAVLMCAGALAFCLVHPFNKGIDFSGGILLELKTDGPADVEDMRDKLAEFSPSIQSLGDAGDIVSVYLAQGNKDERRMNADLAEVKSILGDTVEYRNTQIVGPKVGADLVHSGMLAVVLAILVMSAYIGVRFELPMAVGSILSLSHDVILALFVLNVGGYEFSLTTLAALLTLAGYSINDTVVIYDRIRENLKKRRGLSMAETIDLSINETFSRTILTGVTTILAVASIYFFGGEVLRGFSAVMLFGILIGTYSSVFLSTSTLLLFKKL